MMAQLPALQRRLGVWDRLRPGASALADAIAAIEARVQPHVGLLSEVGRLSPS